MQWFEPEYRRRIRQQAQESRERADREKNKAAEKSDRDEIIAALKGINEKLDRTEDKKSPKNKREFRLRISEIGALSVAAGVGIAAIFVGSRDAGKQQRAWLAPVEMRIDPNSPIDEKKVISLQIILQDTGHEPALNVSSNGHSGAKSVPIGFNDWDNIVFEDNTTCDHLSPKNGGRTVYPSQVYGSDAIFDVTPTDHPDQIIRDIEAGERVLWVNMCFAYTARGSPHFSAVCMYLQPDMTKPITQWRFKFCPAGNWAD